MVLINVISIHRKAEDRIKWSNLITEGNSNGTVRIQCGTINIQIY
jgi:hypothetical protein